MVHLEITHLWRGIRHVLFNTNQVKNLRQPILRLSACPCNSYKLLPATDVWLCSQTPASLTVHENVASCTAGICTVAPVLYYRIA